MGVEKELLMAFQSDLLFSMLSSLCRAMASFSLGHFIETFETLSYFCILSPNARKCRPEITPYLDTFYQATY